MADLGNIGLSFLQPQIEDAKMERSKALLPAEVARESAAARYSNAMADRLETETAAEKKVAGIMAQGFAQGSGPGTVSGTLMQMSQAYGQAGLANKSAELAEKASAASAHESAARSAEARKALQVWQGAKIQTEMVSKLLNGVTDQASWDEANALFERETGKPSPLKDVPYDPKIVDRLKTAALTDYQQKQLAIRDKVATAQVANYASSERSRALRDDLAQQAAERAKEREKRLAKNGGKDVGVPGKTEVDAATRLLSNSGLEGDELDNAAFSIASDAKAMRKANPGLTADEALRQAALAAGQNGSIKPRTKGSFFGIGSKPASFAPPMALPTSGKTSDLKIGQVYKNAKGQTKQWTKDGWKDVGGKSSTPPPPDDEEDDDE